MSRKMTISAALMMASLTATSFGATQPAAGDPISGLTPAELEAFNNGKVAFEKSFLPEEGLGPIFNKESCANCHSGPAIGGASSQFVTRFGYMDDKGGFFDPLAGLGGSLQQVSAISPECEELIPDAANVTAQRITPPIFGAGFVEAIEDADIHANVGNQSNGVTGVVRTVVPLEGGDPTPGRFGWKLGVPTMRTFSGDAFLNEMGITNELVPDENAPNGDAALLALCDMVADPEDVTDENNKTFVDKFTDFQRFLAPPPQTPKSGMTGEALFNQVGCNVCHIAEWTTADDPEVEDAIRDKTFRPYSDFLLHDAGSAGDFIGDGPVLPTEIRTTPLWGIALSGQNWHDGSINGDFDARMLEAISRHGAFGAEAKFAHDSFFGAGKKGGGLSPAEQQQVIDFLQSLGRREFDADINNTIDLVDFLDFKACFGAGGVTPDDACAIHDIDQDGDVDLDDFADFVTVYVGDLGDCNNNGTTDLEEILLGAADANNDGLLDDCQCLADLSGDGMVDSQDLNIVLGAFGMSGAGDINGDFQTNSIDLNLILGAFGQACPE